MSHSATLPATATGSGETMIVDGWLRGSIATIRTFVCGDAAGVGDVETRRRDLAVVEEGVAVAARNGRDRGHQREIWPGGRNGRCAGAHRAEACVARSDGGDVVVVGPAVLEAFVEERGLGGFSDPDLAELAPQALGAVHRVGRGVGDGRPGKARGPVGGLDGHGRCGGRAARATRVDHGRRGAGDLMPVECREDGGHVGRAVRQRPVVVVGREDVEIAARGAAAPARGARVPARHDLAAEVEEPRRDFARQPGREVERGGRQVARREVPGDFGSDHAFAVGFAVARADRALRRAIGPDPGDAVRDAARVVGPIDVPDSGARRACVAVARAVADEEEAPADARGVQAQGGVDVGDRFAGRGDGRVDAVVVHAVAPLVVEDRGNLARVATAVTLAVEVDGDSVPEGVAVVVDVHVRGQLLLEPCVRRQLAPRLLLHPVELVEAGAPGVRVAGRPSCGDRAVGAAAAAEVDVAGVRLVDRSAGVEDFDEPAREGRGDRARNAAGIAAAVGETGSAGGDIRPGHRPAGLLGALRAGAVVGDGEDAADDLVLRVLVPVLQRQDLAGLRVDERLPPSEVSGHAAFDDPDQAIRQRVAAVGRDELEVRSLGAAFDLERLEERFGARGGVGRGDRRNEDGVDVPPAREAEQDEVAVVQRGRHGVSAYGDAVDDAGDVDVSQVATGKHGRPRCARDLRRVDPEGRLPAHVLEDSGRRGLTPLCVVGGRMSGDPRDPVADSGARQQRPRKDERAPAAGSRVEKGAGRRRPELCELRIANRRREGPDGARGLVAFRDVQRRMPEGFRGDLRGGGLHESGQRGRPHPQAEQNYDADPGGPTHHGFPPDFRNFVGAV